MKNSARRDKPTQEELYSTPPRFYLSGRPDFTGGAMTPPVSSVSASRRLCLILAALFGFLFLLDAAPAQAQLAAPGGFSVQAGDGQFTVSWSTLSGANSYAVEISWPGDASTTPVTSSTATSLTVTSIATHTVTNGTAYTVRMRGCTGANIFGASAGCGTWTASKTVTPAANILVSNLSNSQSHHSGLVPGSTAQQFTTGTHSDGYTLTSIELQFAEAATTTGNIRAELWSTASDGTNPDSKLADLTVPSTAGTTSPVTFAAPSDTSLTANTKYFAVIYRTDAQLGRLSYTASGSENSGAATGWSITNGHRTGGLSSGSWGGSTRPLRIRVIGTEKSSAQSSDATLSALTASSATSESGTYTSLSIGTFAAATESYTASVGSGVTHVKLTPTVNESNATVKVGKTGSLTAVNSGSASGAIELGAAGTDTAIKVEVTAQDSSTKTYTVTVSRAAAQSSDATLSALTASKATSATGTYTSLSIGTFASATESYTASVATDVTHVKLTPTVNESNASVKVGKTGSLTAVNSGSASGAIALGAAGTSTAIKVEVTAQDSSTKTYTVTVARAAAQSSDATLSLLTVTKATSSGGTYSAVDFGTFAAATESYTANVATDVTHVKVSPVVNESNATVKVGKGMSLTAVSTGTESGAIALGAAGTDTAIKIEVTAQDGSTKTYTVTVSRAAAQSSDATLSALTASKATSESGTYTEQSIGAFAATTESYTATVDSDVSHMKLTPTVNQSGATVKVGIGTSLTAVSSGTASGAIALGAAGGSTAIKVEVTAQDTSTTKTYTVTVSRAATPTVSLSASPSTVTEGSSTTITATLSSAVTANLSIPVTVTRGTAESGDLDTSNFASSLFFAAGFTQATSDITANQDTDADDETFTVSLGTLPPEVAAGSPSSVTITIADDEAPPGVPSGLRLIAGDGIITARWTAPSGAVTRYEIQHRESGESWPASDTDVTGTTHTIRNLTNGTAYDVRVRAVNSNGAGGWSAARSATPSDAPAVPPSSLTLTKDREAAEGGSVVVGARLDQPATEDMTVALFFSGTATPGTVSEGDYWTSGLVGIYAGDTESYTGEILHIRDDGKPDDGETIRITGTSGDLSGTLELSVRDSGRVDVSEDLRLSGLLIGGSSDGSAYGESVPLRGTFEPRNTDYKADAGNEVTSVKVTPTLSPSAAGATIRVSGRGRDAHAVESGSESGSIEICKGINDAIEVEVSRGGKSRTYEVEVVKGFNGTKPKFILLHAQPGGKVAYNEKEKACATAEVPHDATEAVLRVGWGDGVSSVKAKSASPDGTTVYTEESIVLDYDKDKTRTNAPRRLALAPDGPTLVTVTVSGGQGETTTYRVTLERGAAPDARRSVTTPTTGGGGPSPGGGGPSPGGGGPSPGGGGPSPGGGGGGAPPGGNEPPPGDGEQPPPADAFLSDLRVSEGILVFRPRTLSYEVTVGPEVTAIAVTPATVNGRGEETEIELEDEGPTPIEISVTASDGTVRTYRVTVTREEECAISDEEALRRFYEATGGEMGVKRDGGRIVSLLLADSNLEGTIPGELSCLAELKELALWGNEGLSGHIPQRHVLAVERAALLYVAQALSLNTEWFEDYEEPFSFEDWHSGVTTDNGRVTELDFSGEDVMGVIPAILLRQLERLETLDIECSGVTVGGAAPAGVTVREGCDGEMPGEERPGDGGGCALGSPGGEGASVVLLLLLLALAASGMRRREAFPPGKISSGN